MAKKTAKSKTKKSAAKKAPAKKTSAKKSAAKTKGTKSVKSSKLIKELNKLTKKLNGEELEFIVNQAKVIIYNKQVVQDRKEGKTTKSSVKKSDFSLPGINKEKIEIVEGEDGSHFIIVIDRARNFFSREEMKKIVKICHAAEDEKDAGARLYNYFDNNRADVLKGSEISGPGDAVLHVVYKTIISAYTVKG